MLYLLDLINCLAQINPAKHAKTIAFVYNAQKLYFFDIKYLHKE